MKVQLSDFGRKFSARSGIYELMEDLGRALSEGGKIMMGGGNPAHIPEVEAVWRRRLNEILAKPGAMETMLGDYDTPRGRPDFLETLASFFNRQCGWNITADNIAVTIGSQAANFLLFNMLAGRSHGSEGANREMARTILFPLVPEYIGYCDQGVSPGMFRAWKPEVEFLSNHDFKYRMQFGKLDEDVAALCLSRPTNPSANLVTDEEIARLVALARARGIYLIIDHAYGQPFPNVVFKKVQPVWDECVIHAFSLSKLGLPTTRTGIVVASPEIIERIGIMNASLVLATSTIGQAIIQPLLASDEITQMCERCVRPFYKHRSDQTRAWIAECFDDSLDYHVHVCEGAFFFWLWLRGMRINDRELYERLKARGVLIVPGSYFFPGLNEPWEHKQQCIRVTYCAEPSAVRRGIEILAEEIKRAYEK